MKSTLDANIIIVCGPSRMHSRHIVTLTDRSDPCNTPRCPGCLHPASCRLDIWREINPKTNNNFYFSLSSLLWCLKEANRVNIIARSYVHHHIFVYINVCVDTKTHISLQQVWWGLQQSYVWSVWYTKVWSLAFIMNAWFNSHMQPMHVLTHMNKKFKSPNVFGIWPLRLLLLRSLQNKPKPSPNVRGLHNNTSSTRAMQGSIARKRIKKWFACETETSVHIQKMPPWSSGMEPLRVLLCASLQRQRD